jgi:hypothetical protein
MNRKSPKMHFCLEEETKVMLGTFSSRKNFGKKKTKTDKLISYLKFE